MVGRVPPGGRPQDIEAARAVLGSVLVDPACIDALVLRLSPEDFYSARHAALWAALRDMHREGRPIDLVLANEWLAGRGALEAVGGTAALVELSECVPSSANVDYYASTVQRTADFRRLIRASAEVQAWAFDAPPNTTPGDVQREADRIVRSVLPDRAPSGAPLGAFAGAVVERAVRGEQPVVWPTGFRDLDERLGGGVRPGQMNLIAARPGMGKTAFLTRAARQVAGAGIGVSLFSLEMHGEELAGNMLGAEAGVSPRRVQAGALTGEEWRRVHAARVAFGALPLTVHEGRRMRLGDLVAAIRHDARRGARVVAVDYLQLVEPDERGRSRAEEVAEISRELKLLALDLGVALLAAAQLSREIEKRREKWPTMSDLRESGALEQDADNILLLHRPEVYEPEKEDLRGLAHVDVAKQRNGPPGVVDLRWEAACMRFEDVERLEPWQRAARERQAQAAAAGGDA